MRYLFEIAYDGTRYHGWQRQKNAISVQEVVEEALSRITREHVTITGSGRTDTGVHCEQQFFHADLENPAKKDQLHFKLNSYLPTDISIQSIQVIRDDAHARFDAEHRAYEYRIVKTKSPFLHGYSYYFTKKLDVKTMNDASALLLGVHDFQAFSKVNTEVNNFICSITSAQWREEGDLLIFYIEANRFLRGMVRAIVGTLLQVGLGKLSLPEFRATIDSKDRKQAGAAAPPEGLFLIKVEYPQSIYK